MLSIEGGKAGCVKEIKLFAAVGSPLLRGMSVAMVLSQLIVFTSARVCISPPSAKMRCAMTCAMVSPPPTNL